MISLKNAQEIAIMREGGKIAARILNLLQKSAKPGMTTLALDQIAARELKNNQAKASFLGLEGYPASICTSINEEVVHGIPSKKILKDGDILGLDIGIYYQGFHTDCAITIPIGKIEYQKKVLIEITKKALEEGISIIREGMYLGDVQNRIQTIVEGAGYHIIRDLAGHGIGKNLQEPPSITNFGKKGTGPILKAGVTLAIEPMVSAGDWHIKILDDGWTVVTLDGSLSAHFEDTIAVTKKGVEVLTRE